MISQYSPTVAFISLGKSQQGTKQRRSSEVYVGAIARICLIHLLPGFAALWKNQVNELPRTFLDGRKEH
jgi:hypothetical protein